ncbi:MAG: hypothetical protein Q8N31_23170 [Reyranella sp.]|nr:hypothetical protein [Reyranella sp.]MDP3162924.1 hypothetical protein [Reyranella sp.]
MMKRININGDFDVWQLGTSWAPMYHAHMLADMWRYANTTNASHNIALSTDAPTFAQAGRKISQSAMITCTSAAACGSTQNLGLVYRGEGYEWAPCWQQQTTILFWVKSTKTRVFFTGLANSAQDLSCPMAYTINTANTWEYKSVTLPASPASTWYFDYRVGYSLYFFLASGSMFWGTAGVWNSGQQAGDSSQVDFNDTNGATFQLAGVQLEVGTSATSFGVWRFEDELRHCQRYIEKSFRPPGSVACRASPGSSSPKPFIFHEVIHACFAGFDRGPSGLPRAAFDRLL